MWISPGVAVDAMGRGLVLAIEEHHPGRLETVVPGLGAQPLQAARSPRVRAGDGGARDGSRASPSAPGARLARRRAPAPVRGRARRCGRACLPGRRVRGERRAGRAVRGVAAVASRRPVLRPGARVRRRGGRPHRRNRAVLDRGLREGPGRPACLSRPGPGTGAPPGGLRRVRASGSRPGPAQGRRRQSRPAPCASTGGWGWRSCAVTRSTRGAEPPSSGGAEAGAARRPRPSGARRRSRRSASTRPLRQPRPCPSSRS